MSTLSIVGIMWRHLLNYGPSDVFEVGRLCYFLHVLTFKHKAGAPAVRGVEVDGLWPRDHELPSRVQRRRTALRAHLIQHRLRPSHESKFVLDIAL